jgi:AbrB family looped-hinge helix DNA binding protein
MRKAKAGENDWIAIDNRQAPSNNPTGLSMRTKIDQSGRCVLPKALRDQLGIKPGDKFDIEMTGDGLRLKLVHDSPRLVKMGGVLVFVGGKLANPGEDFVKKDRDARIAELIRQAMSKE